MKLLRKVAKAAGRHEVTWRYVMNFRAAMHHRLHRSACSGESARVLETLRRDGVAVTSVDALFGGSGVLEELMRVARTVCSANADKIAAARELALSPDCDPLTKPFTLEVLGSRPKLDLDSIFVRVALDRRVLDIANAYFGMSTRLREWNLWYTFATPHPARSSQLWHRDYDDLHRVLKGFVYLTDVDEGAGPFTYARGSHAGGKDLRREPDYISREGHTTRSDDAQMAEAVTPDRWLTCTGCAGTVVFADTHGYHKGGLARAHDRLMHICMYTSPLAQSVELFERTGRALLPSDPVQAFALAPPAGVAPDRKQHQITPRAAIRV